MSNFKKNENQGNRDVDINMDEEKRRELERKGNVQSPSSTRDLDRDQQQMPRRDQPGGQGDVSRDRQRDDRNYTPSSEPQQKDRGMRDDSRKPGTSQGGGRDL